MANKQSDSAWNNHEIDFVPDFYLPANPYQPTTPSRRSYWNHLIEQTGSLSRLARTTMKWGIFVLIAWAGLVLGKPAVAEAPVLDQLPGSVNVNQIFTNVTAAQVSNRIASVASTPDSNENTSTASASSHQASPSTTVEEESTTATSEPEAVTDSVSTESATSEESTSSSSAEENSVYEGSTGCCIWPTRGRVTSRVTRWHTAIDISAPYWTPVVAADGGRVIAAGWDRTGYGYRMIIDHGSGLTTLYAHLSRYYYDYGDYVNKGMIIGRVGSTGNSSGNHLHFEVRVHNYRQNPWNWLP